MTDYSKLREREFDWDDIIENDSSFTTLPEGVYPFTVTAFERARHPGSAKLPPCNKAQLTIEIDGGSLGISTVKHNLFLHAKCEGLLCAFFTSVGLRQHGERKKMPWDKVIGAKGTCKVIVDHWKSEKNGQNMEGNKIAQFLPPEKASVSTPAAASPAGAASQIFDLSRGSQPQRADLESRRDSNLPASSSNWTPGQF